MKYAHSPKIARQMLNLCHEGNKIFEVIVLYRDGSISWHYVQAPSATQAKKIVRGRQKNLKAIPRLIIPD